MIRDLQGNGKSHLKCEVLIIGGGTAGLVLTTLLHRKGVRTLCVESGGLHQDDETHVLNTVVQTGTPYKGAENGRFRCLGGTSTRWGGALIPLLAADLSGAGWPVSASELAPWVAAVERLFDLPSGSYDDDIYHDPSDSFGARHAKWPPFSKRNVYNLFASELESEAGPEVWINATVTDFRVAAGLLKQVTAEAKDGSQLTIEAEEFIVSAGAIESTRLLLLLDRQNGELISRKSNSLGRYFHDHLSCVVADLKVTDRLALNRMVGFKFESNGAMRNTRFELHPDTRLRATIRPCFAHVAFEEGEGGFNALRNCFRALQKRQLPSLAVVSRLLLDLPWLAHAIWWRFIEKRLLYPKGSRVQLHMVIEQEPITQHGITLSNEKTDIFKQPLAEIHWTVTQSDRQNMHKAVAALSATWDRSALGRVSELEVKPASEIENGMEECGGIFHPGGSTRMGHTAESGVVDKDLRVFAVPNVRVVSTSVLPTGGGANPTMTLLMLAVRCVEDVVLKLQRCND